MAFSSLQKMNNLKTARNDDIISLFYMIIYLANGDKIPKLEQIQESSVSQAISLKQDQSLEKILSTFGHENYKHNCSDEFLEAQKSWF